MRPARHAGLPAVAPRPRVPRPLLWAALGLTVAVAWVGLAANKQSGDPELGALASEPAVEPVVPVPARPGVDQAADRSSRDRVIPAAAGVTFAEIDGLQLTLPHQAPVLVAFHEATRAEALGMAPTGQLLRNDNPTKFDPPADQPGPGYAVLASRGRARPATSAADIAVPEGSLISAPVTGTVVEVRQYALYGSTRDWRVVIEPAERSDLHVVLIHLHQPRVRPGDVVHAGSSVLAAVRTLSFASHIDYVIGEDLGTDARHPHTHIEVKPATRPEPLDPNEPAAAPEGSANH
jgi:hypothetical protein